jgi:hypothetical protein
LPWLGISMPAIAPCTAEPSSGKAPPFVLARVGRVSAGGGPAELAGRRAAAHNVGHARGAAPPMTNPSGRPPSPLHSSAPGTIVLDLVWVGVIIWSVVHMLEMFASCHSAAISAVQQAAAVGVLDSTGVHGLCPSRENAPQSCASV